MSTQYARGEIFYCDMPQIRGCKSHSVEKGCRPVVIVSSLIGSLTNNIVMVCPLTTKEKKLLVNVPIGWSKDTRASYVLCNQIMTVPKNILGEPVGKLTQEELQNIDKALLIALGIQQ